MNRPVILPVGGARPAELAGLHNVFRLSHKLYSGSAPEGAAGFASLQSLGIHTVISVDGARPEIEQARRYGLRYVHLPFGYDGCPTPRALEIVRAVRDLCGSVYIHCHHGKHRGAAAAALVHIAIDRASKAEAVAFMRRAGTSPAYPGLYEGVATFRRPSAAEIARVPARFPEVATVPPLATAMVQIDARLAALRQSQQRGWEPPRDQPDRLPAGEALLLRELFHELQRVGERTTRPADFWERLGAAEAGSAALETALRADGRAQADTALAQIAATCDSCHIRYRNVPHNR